jgi:hypothetical protein
MVTNKRIEMITAVTTSGNKSRHRKDKGYRNRAFMR